jgi:hypothetical protein
MNAWSSMRLFDLAEVALLNPAYEQYESATMTDIMSVTQRPSAEL